MINLIDTNLLNHPEIVELISSSEKLSFAKNEIILKQGIKSTHLIYLQQGMVKFNYEDEAGRNLILTIQKAPTILGLANILNDDFNLFSVCSLEDCVGFTIDIHKLKDTVFTNRDFFVNIIKLSSEMFRTSIFNFISLAHKQVNGRIADILIYLSKNIYCNTTFNLTLSRQELAEFAGCSKENVIHTLRNLANEGIIDVKGKYIDIKKMDRLMYFSKIG